MKNISRAFKMLPGWQRILAGIVFVGVFQSAATVAVPLAIQRIIDNLIAATTKNASLSVIILPLSIWLVLRLALSLIIWLGEIVSDNAFTQAVVSFREQTVVKLENLPISYYETRRAGQLTAEVNQSPNLFANWLQNVSENYLTTILQAVFALTVLAYKFLPMAFMVLVLAVIYWFYTFRTIKTNSKFWKRNRKVINEWSGVQTENISFVSDIRALGIQKQRGNLYKKLLHEHRTNLILAVYLGSISTAVNRLNRVWSDTVNVEDTLGETLDILDQEDTVKDPIKALKLSVINELDFNNVKFSYSKSNNEALRGLNFKITRGTTTALVGRSGSGKSTIVKLLLRFYDPSSGEILLNKKPLEDFKQEDFRKRLGVVMQDVALFNGTVLTNVTIAQPEASEEEVIRACKLAHAHDFITELPDGYNTLVGERGVKLSGGEKQRISIARAILRDPELILLDEATSALDSESEKAVQAGLSHLLKNRTAVVIAHRLSTIKYADNILVIDRGRLVESGTFEYLKNKNGLFTELLAHQEI